MTSPAVTVRPSTDVAEAADTLITRGFKSMPVVDEHHRVLGVVSRSDLIRSRAREDGEVARDIDEILGTLGHDDWSVQVQEGVVSIDGPTTPTERSLAESAASNVAGVVQVRVRTP
jgi:predicted transcriptional regulator